MHADIQYLSSSKQKEETGTLIFLLQKNLTNSSPLIKSNLGGVISLHPFIDLEGHNAGSLSFLTTLLNISLARPMTLSYLHWSTI